MTISTPHIDCGASCSCRSRPRLQAVPAGAQARRGFTLAEVMIAATISTFVLAGVLSAFLMIGRSGFLASSYSELESETRRALEIFGNDARKATDIRWNSSSNITLWVATATNATNAVTYAYDRDDGSATKGCFYRLVGEADSTLPRRILVRNVNPDFTFERFKLEQSSETDNRATSDLETKQVQVTMRARRSGSTTVSANQAALSARYILRNKRVAN